MVVRKRSLLMKQCHAVRKKTAWRVDYDYLSKLTLEELEFLADFTNFFYHGTPRKAKSIKLTKKMYKESYDRNNTAERDILTKLDIKFLNYAVNNIKLDNKLNNR